MNTWTGCVCNFILRLNILIWEPTVLSLSPFFLTDKHNDSVSGAWTTRTRVAQFWRHDLALQPPQCAISDLHMLAVSTRPPPYPPQCPVSSLVIVWSRQSFISSVSGSVGLGQDRRLDRFFWVTRNSLSWSGLFPLTHKNRYSCQ